MSVVVDTSIWVDYLKLGQRGPGAGLVDLLTQQEVVACGPVVAELLAGTAPTRRAQLWTLISGLPWIDLRPAGWRRVGQIVGDLLARGHTVPLTDVQIAVMCFDNDSALWSRDTHFEPIGEVLPGLRRFAPPASKS